MIRVTAFTALVVAVALTLTACTPPSRADRRADEIAEAIADRLTPQTPQRLDAEYLAQSAIDDAADGSYDSESHVEALGWSGRVDDGEEATLTLRISVDLPGQNTSGFGGDIEASSTVRCYELVVRYLYDYDPQASDLSRIACPPGAVAARPDPVPLASMPGDVEARLTRALAGATVDDAESRVREEFPDPGWSVVVEERDGVLVVALGAIIEGGCAVGVRHPDGTVEVLRGFSPESLLPGEIGCHPMLVLGGIDTSGG